jgi:hypothetical protein
MTTYTHIVIDELEPVGHGVIAGALFDFMGWLTSRKERLTLSSADNASPAVEAIAAFAKMRGLSLSTARVEKWHDMVATPVRELTNDDLEEIARRVLAQGYKHRDFEVRFARAVIDATLGRTA